jgi:hypothetical protein
MERRRAVVEIVIGRLIRILVVFDESTLPFGRVVFCPLFANFENLKIAKGLF